MAYRPDALDPVAYDLEGVHRYGDAVLLGDQAGLAVDRTLQNRQIPKSALEVDQGAADLLGAFDRVEHGADNAAAVGDRRRVGVEEPMRA
ncbi:hypothetical protein [Micromonospora sp. DH14]|uniref:hypothetical protein n=1 Tax=Micromonospora sp. DH14 TaxID=3040120 RepID=UPI002441D93F|nr:hypothetical protein [Micromonospora sp. DH14]MDG9675946.1 hypothetical protein [Micromonospora sp. DH14]